MDLYHIGKHCNVKSCNVLDFLPYTCSGCKLIFCQEHWKVEAHQCPNSQSIIEDVRVPTCPVCQQPVPVPKGADPNLWVNQHIESGCKTTTSSSSTKIYSNVCQFEQCRQKEAIPFICKNCGKNFCKKHRLDMDHHCSPPSSSFSNWTKKKLSTTKDKKDKNECLIS